MKCAVIQARFVDPDKETLPRPVGVMRSRVGIIHPILFWKGGWQTGSEKFPDVFQTLQLEGDLSCDSSGQHTDPISAPDQIGNAMCNLLRFKFEITGDR